MSTGLTALQAAVSDLAAKVAAVDADVKKLVANSQPGLQPGQVIVNQADIDALTSSVGAASGVLAADDTAANAPKT
jgi:outer membrane murein-binding lipoprotein Lpp